MALKNYSVSRFTTTETAGDSGNLGTMITSGTLTIRPKTGYVLSASNFSVKNLPNSVSSVVFTDSTTADTMGNIVTATVNINPNFIMPSESVDIKIDITSAANTPVLASTVGLDAEILLEEDKDPGDRYASITLTPTTGYTITETDSSVGVSPAPDKPKINYKITGKVLPNKRIKLATLNIKADNDYRFAKTPIIRNNTNANNYVSFKLVGVEKDERLGVTQYNYDVLYKSSVKTTKSNDIKSTLTYSAVYTGSERSEVYTITKVDFGESTIAAAGENRLIKIHGTPKTPFTFSLTRKSTQSSILNTTLANSTELNPVFGTVDTLEGTIPLKGLYCFNQSFPSSKTNTTTLTSDMSSTATMPLTDTTGIKEGDKLIISSIDYKVTPTVNSVDSTTQVTLSGNISATKGDTVSFIRSDEYYINIDPTNRSFTRLTNLLNSNGVVFDGLSMGENVAEKTLASGNMDEAGDETISPYNYKLTQHINPIFTIRVNDTNANLNSTGAATVGYIGRASTRNSTRNTTVGTPKVFSISYTLTAQSAHTHLRTGVGGGVNSDGVIVFSNTDSTKSDFSNTTYADNGGTKFRIYNIFQTDTSTATVTSYSITFDVKIEEWGTKDVEVVLDLDEFITTL